MGGPGRARGPSGATPRWPLPGEGCRLVPYHLPSDLKVLPRYLEHLLSSHLQYISRKQGARRAVSWGQREPQGDSGPPVPFMCPKGGRGAAVSVADVVVSSVLLTPRSETLFSVSS